MNERDQILAGKRFQATGLTMFGTPQPTVFEIGSVQLDAARIPHACLFNVKDPKDRRLIAIGALRDRHLFIEVKS